MEMKIHAILVAFRARRIVDLEYPWIESNRSHTCCLFTHLFDIISMLKIITRILEGITTKHEHLVRTLFYYQK